MSKKLPECPVCLMPYNLAQRKPLYICQNSHSICEECHAQAIKIISNAKCPLCKRALNIKIRQNNDIIQLIKLHRQYRQVANFSVQKQGKQDMKKITIDNLSKDEGFMLFFYVIMGIVGIFLLVNFIKLASSMLRYEKTFGFFVFDLLKSIIGSVYSVLVFIWETLKSIGDWIIINVFLNLEYILSWPLCIVFWLCNFGVVLFTGFLVLLSVSALVLKWKWNLEWSIDIESVDFQMPQQLFQNLIFFAIYKFTKFVFDNYYLHQEDSMSETQF